MKLYDIGSFLFAQLYNAVRSEISIRKFKRIPTFANTKNFNYFSADTPLSQVKISELGAWFGRRNKSPQAIAGACSRAWWRWQHKYVQPKRAGIAPFFQLVTASMIFFYAINYGKMSE